MTEHDASPQGDHNIIVQAQGDGINITVGLPHLTLVPWQNRVRDDLKRDIQILDAAYRAVPLIGRECDLEFLSRWLEGSAIKVATLIGRGGAGKTRLALELLEKMPDDWYAGFLTPEEGRRFIEHSDISAWGWQRPTLIVVDYAAALGLTLAAWLRGLADHSPSKSPLRILLLERHAGLEGGWYHSLFDPSRQPTRVAELFSPLEPRTLAPLDDSAQRREVLGYALARARPFYSERPAPAIPTPGIHVHFDKLLEDPQWADPLLLLMAALVACENGFPAALSLSRPELAKNLADKEARRIRHGFDPQDPQSVQDADLLVHLYACVTLCGGLDRERLLKLAKQECEELGMSYSRGPGAAVNDLAVRAGAVSSIPTMTPDLLAEAFWLGVLGKQNITDGVEVVKRVFPLAVASVVAVLIRSATDFSRAGESLPLAALKAIAESPQADLDLKLVIERALPQDSLALSDFALSLTREIVELLLPIYLYGGSTDGRAVLAGMLDRLSSRQSAIEDRKGALQSITEAVRIYYELSLTKREKFFPELAGSLINLSTRQRGVGDPTGALQSITESVRIYRVLSASSPDQFLPELSLSLNNLSNRQSDTGNFTAGLTSIVEAVEIRRKLSGSDPKKFMPDLAQSLNNLSNRRVQVGDVQGALESISEAVRIFRDLSASDPDRFLLDFARSLGNLSTRQARIGDRDGALESIEETVRVFRDLSVSASKRFLPDLAKSLIALSSMQVEAGNHPDALVSIIDAARILHDLSVLNPDRFLPELALSLSILGDQLCAVGRQREAMETFAKSIRLLEPFYIRYPEAFRAWAPATVRDYLVQSRQLGVEPDEQLLLPYQAVIAEYNLRLEEGESE
ncbi:tetratricopeptide (TPR) repeat protein [Granulicella aggregans]|uniref:Tetratricopeptide (TPR) repeat protein n=1 Tax=Granulicella aggregans TaxID=474949 RepID=A0A7W7ZCK3_9BACT|nr:tetratricopeptide repeat protein [Granulicella aggregans]MBB5057430.1 tetratricopeptide (TPR) repeat protein [Granulicella aggregans]